MPISKSYQWVQPFVQSDAPKINLYLDLDDVLVPWKSTVFRMMHDSRCEIMGRGQALEFSIHCVLGNFDKLDELLGGRRAMMKLVNDAGPEFWANLPKYPHADRLLSIPDQLPFVNLRILTNPSNFRHSYDGKIDWAVRNHFPWTKMVITKEKWLLANSHSLLVDDLAMNCEKFRIAGGRSIQWPWTEDGLNPDSYIEQIIHTLQAMQLEHAS